MSDAPAAEPIDTNLALPLARVKRIAKSSKDVRLLSADSAYMISKATVRFFPCLPSATSSDKAKRR